MSRNSILSSLKSDSNLHRFMMKFRKNILNIASNSFFFILLFVARGKQVPKNLKRSRKN